MNMAVVVTVIMPVAGMVMVALTAMVVAAHL
jgi:hypothetical protein